MSASQSLVDHIVARVLERLGNNQAACLAPAEGVASPATVFSEKVLTEQILSDRVRGSLAISIGPDSILTPSAKDYLRQQNITWTRSSDAGSTSLLPAVQQSLIILDEPSSLTSLAVGEWNVTRVSTVSEAIQGAIDSVRTNGAVILAGAAEAIACEANRDSRVRAVAVCSLERLQKAASDLQPNVICIDPTGPGLFKLREILKAAKGLVKE